MTAMWSSGRIALADNMPRFIARSRCAGWATLAAVGVPPGPHAGSGGVGDVTSSDDAASTSVSVTAGGTGGDCIVVMGSEGDGLRTNVLRECSGVISVPVSERQRRCGHPDGVAVWRRACCRRQPQTESGHQLSQCYHNAT